MSNPKPNLPTPPADPATAEAPGNDGPALSPLTPETMHRAESDAAAQATSPDFTERPRRATHTAPAATVEPHGGSDDDANTR